MTKRRLTMRSARAKAASTGRPVADLVHEADIVRRVLPDARGVRGERRLAGNDRSQRLKLDIDQLGRVGGLFAALGNDKGDIVADPAHPILGQRRETMAIGRRSTPPPQPAWRRQIPPVRFAPISAGQHSQYAGRGFGPRRVDPPDASMRVGGAQYICKRHARQHHVVDIAPAAAQQPRILEARHRLPQREFAHPAPPKYSCRLHV